MSTGRRLSRSDPRLPRRLRVACALLLTMSASACTSVGATGSAPVAGAPPRAGGVPPGGYAALERSVLAELNAARTDPAGYARTLDALIPYFDGRVLRRPGESVGVSTQEGAKAVREAASALRGTAPMGALTRSGGMTAGARALVEDLGPRGGLGHTGSDGSTPGARVNRHGRWVERITESIAYGPATGESVVQGLLIDDGVPDRGHRRNLLDRTVRVAGIACGPHARYGTMCVIDLAGGYEER